METTSQFAGSSERLIKVKVFSGVVFRYQNEDHELQQGQLLDIPQSKAIEFEAMGLLRLAEPGDEDGIQDLVAKDDLEEIEHLSNAMKASKVGKALAAAQKALKTEQEKYAKLLKKQKKAERDAAAAAAEARKNEEIRANLKKVAQERGITDAEAAKLFGIEDGDPDPDGNPDDGNPDGDGNPEPKE